MTKAFFSDRLDVMFRERGRTAVVLVAAAVLALCLLKFDTFQVGAYVDDAQYVVLARSIAQGTDYGLIDGPGPPRPSKYPFGWPLILAAEGAVFGWSLEAAKAVALCFTIGNVLLLALAWRGLGFATANQGMAAAALFGLSHTVVGLAGTTMSDPASLFFVLLSLALTHTATSRERPPWWVAPALGACWLFTGVVRTVGVTAVAASALWLIWKRRLGTLAVAGACLAATFAVIDATTVIDVRDIFGSSMYVSEMNRKLAVDQGERSSSDIVSAAIAGTINYLTVHIPDALVPFAGTQTGRSLLARLHVPWALVPATLCLLLLSGAIADIWVRGIRPVHIYVPAYLAIVMVWPWAGERFLYGVLPFLFVYLLDGVRVAVSAVTPRSRRELPATVAAVAFALLLTLQGVRSVLIQNFLDHLPNLQAGMGWVAGNTSPDAVVMAEQTQSVYVYSDRKSVPMAAPEKVHGEDGRPEYVLIAPALEWRADGSLVYSTATEKMLGALRDGRVAADLVFEDAAARVLIFKLRG